MWLLPLFIVATLWTNCQSIKCYVGNEKDPEDCQDNFCISAVVFFENTTLHMRDCEHKLGKAQSKYNFLIDKDVKPQIMCLSIFNRGFNIETYTVDATLVNSTVPTKYVAYKRCCFTDECNKEFSIFDVTNMARVIERENEVKVARLANPETQTEEDAKIDSHFEAAEDIQMVLCVILLTLFCGWPYYYLNRYTKSIAALQEEQYRKLEENCCSILEWTPKYTQQRNSKMKVSGKLTLRELVDLLYYLDNPPRDTNPEVGKPRKVLTGIQQQKELRAGEKRKFVFSEFSYDAIGDIHPCPRVNRLTYPKYEQMLWRLFEHGPYRYDFRPIDLLELFDQAKDLFAAEPTLLNLHSPIVVFGDLRGQYSDLHRWIQIVGPPPKTKYIFAGGILDNREPGSIECMALIAAMKVRFPTDVYVIRGVGEVMPFKLPPKRFSSAKNSAAIEHTVMRMCSQLPLAARINGRVLVVHSGVSHKLSNLKCFKSVVRPFYDYDISSLARQLIFNTPTHAIRMYRHEGEHRAEHFGMRAVEQILSDHKMDMVIRARNPIKNGVLFMARGRLVNLWSAVSKDTDAGCVLEFDKDNACIVHRLNSAFDKTAVEAVAEVNVEAKDAKDAKDTKDVKDKEPAQEPASNPPQDDKKDDKKEEKTVKKQN